MRKRNLKEYQYLLQNPIEGVKLQYQMGPEVKWIIYLEGPKGSLYYGGQFKLIFTFPDNYPFKPPKVEFLTNIYHIYLRNGYCSCCCYLVDILNREWSPYKQTENVIKVLKSIYFDNVYIEPDHRHREAYELMTRNKQLYQQKINEVMAEEKMKDCIQNFIAYKKYYYELFNINPDQIFVDLFY